jgi:hypothetical protein
MKKSATRTSLQPKTAGKLQIRIKILNSCILRSQSKRPGACRRGKIQNPSKPTATVQRSRQVMRALFKS